MTSFVVLNITHWEYFIILIKELTSEPTHIKHQSLHTASPKPGNPSHTMEVVLLPKTRGARVHTCAEV